MASAGVTKVWLGSIGKFGGKVPMDVWMEEFSCAVELPMKAPLAFDLGARFNDPNNLYLLGARGGTATFAFRGRQMKACTHRILSGQTTPGLEAAAFLAIQDQRCANMCNATVL